VIVIASLAAAFATFLGSLSVLIVGFGMHRAELVPSAHAAGTSVAPRESSLVGAKGVVYESTPVASIIDRSSAPPSMPMPPARRFAANPTVRGPAGASASAAAPVAVTASSRSTSADEAGF
jgi:hypothetical protein